MLSGALDSPYLLLSHPTVVLASHITIILIRPFYFIKIKTLAFIHLQPEWQKFLKHTPNNLKQPQGQGRMSARQAQLQTQGVLNAAGTQVESLSPRPRSNSCVDRSRADHSG